MKKGYQTFPAIALLALGFIACEVGLGSSIDAAAPTVSVSYPPQSSIVRGTFTLAGSCKDDKEIAGVKVTLKNTDSETPVVYGNYDAVVDKCNKLWKCSLNNQGGIYNGWSFPDGKYTADVVSIDTSGKTSGTSSLSFEIDNTAPVFILNGPGTTKIESPAVFASAFKVTGTISDDHTVKYMHVSVYKKGIDGKPDEKIGSTHSFLNVETAGGSSVIVAKYNKHASDKDPLALVYDEIYSAGDTSSSTRSYYCSVEVEDSARLYTQSADDEESGGNKTSCCYLYDDVYEKFQSESGYGLDVSGLKKIINGTYSGVITGAAVDEIRTGLLSRRTDTAKDKTPVAFSLNPDASPKYIVTGYSFSGEKISSFAVKGQKITVMFSAGRDGINITPATFAVYLFGPYDSFTHELLSAVYRDPLKYSVDNEANLIKKYTNETYSSSSVQSYPMTITLPSGNCIKTGKYYLIAATGSDLNNFELDNDSMYYGFKVMQTGVPPVLTIKDPENQSYLKETEGLNISGTAASESDSIGSISYVIRVTDKNNHDNAIGTISGKTEDGNVVFDSLTGKWKFNITDGKGYDVCRADSASGKVYDYYIDVTAKSDNMMSAQKNMYIYVDAKKPVPVISGITPLSSEGDAECVNGTIYVTYSIDENYLDSVRLTAEAGKDEITVYNDPSSSLNKFAIDTTDTSKYKDGSMLNIKLYAKDKAGNENSVTSSYKISQESDKPVVNITNADSSLPVSEISIGKNLFNTSANNRLSVIITDDDGLYSPVNIKCFRVSDNSSVSDSDIKITEGAMQTSFSYELPSSEGRYRIEITAYDKLYESASEANKAYHKNNPCICYVAVDKGGPVFSGITPANGRYYLSSVPVAGTVTDSSGKITVKASGSGISAGYASEQTFISTSAAISDTVNISELPDEGTKGYTVTYTATDLYGQESSCSINYYKDTTAPLFVDADSKVGGIASSSGVNNSWYKAEALAVEGKYIESGSGVSSIYWWLKRTGEEPVNDSTPLTSATGSFIALNTSGKALYKAAISGFSEYGAAGIYNHLYFVAADNAGNRSTIQTYIVKIDQTAPEIMYDGDSMRLTNKKQPLKAEGLFTESAAGSGVKSIELINGSDVLVTQTFFSGNKWSITVPVEKIREGSVKARITDNAGNSNVSSLFTVQTDICAPLFTVSESLPRTDINGIKTVSGTVTENNTPSSFTLYYSVTNEDAASSGDIIPDSWHIFGSTDRASEIYNWSFDNFDFNTLSGAAAADGVRTIYLLPVVYDTAGNCSVHAPDDWIQDFRWCSKYSIAFKVDMNSDRPVIKMNEIENDGSSLNERTVRRYYSSVTGTVTDDDGIAVFKISPEAKTTQAEWEAYVQPAGTLEWMPNGAFSYTPEKNSDGDHSLYFYIEDSEGRKFWTAYADGVSALLNRPYILYKGKSSAQKTDNSSVVVYKSDSNPPAINKISYVTGSTQSSAVTAAKQENYLEFGSSVTFGGSVKKFAVFNVDAADINGIKSVEASIGGGSAINFMLTDGIYKSAPVNTADYGTGAYTINFKVIDGCGLVSQKQQTVIIDFTAPEVKITTPIQTQMVTGAVTVRGTASDTYSGIKSVKYLIKNNNYARKSDDEIIALLQSAEDSQYNSGSLMAWEYIFDGVDHDGKKNPLLPATAAELEDYSLITHTPDGIYTLPVYLLVTDTLGNYNFKNDYSIRYNPFSDRPSVRIFYPVPPSGQSDVKLSGTIRISGSAEDNVSVDSVYLQIALGADGRFDSAMKDTVAGLKDDSGIPYYKILTKSNIDLHADFSADPDFWGIKANGTASWYFSINDCRELQNVFTCNKAMAAANDRMYTFKIRAAAIDNNRKLGPWSDPVTVVINPSTPSIGSSVPAYVVQFDSAGNETARLNYSSDMYLKGKWYLITSVEHNNGIADTWYYQGAGETQLTEKVNMDLSGWTGRNLHYDAAGTSGYTVKIPLNTDSGAGKTLVRIWAQDTTENHLESFCTYSFNYDNNAPSIDSIKYNTADFTEGSVLQNSNNMLTLSGNVTDEDSGFKRLLFYFYRDTTGFTDGRGRRIYDPMINHKANGADSRINVIDRFSSHLLDGITCEILGGQPLYGVSKAVGRPSESSLTVPEKDVHIRTGGLVKIGGTFHRIAHVSDSGQEIDFTPSCAASYTTAFFPYAQVADNTGAEKIRSFTAESCEFAAGDDGDGMPETVTKSGKTWNWDSTLHANFMPDGPVTFVCFAFDDSGNVSARAVKGSIQTNRPRLAKVHFGTDLNGNGTFSDSEFETYNIIEVEGVEQDSYNLTTKNYKKRADSSYIRNSFKIKNQLAVVPEFTGGNGVIKMIYKKDASGENSGFQTGSGSELLSAVPGMLAAGNSAVTASPFVLTNENITGKSSYTDEEDSYGRAMSFTFWDSTEELVQGTESQYCFLRVNDFEVDLMDSVIPKVVIAPFFWDGRESNSMYKHSSDNGHIELPENLPQQKFSGHGIFDKDPKVSGKISLRGYAYDDYRLSSLWIKIDKFYAVNNYLHTDGNYGTHGQKDGYYKVADFNVETGNWTVAGAGIDAEGWQFTVKTDLPKGETAVMYGTKDSAFFNQSGHKVFWQLDIDTSRITGVASADLYVRVMAVDHKTDTGNASSRADRFIRGDISQLNVPFYKMDVVPYITGICTPNRRGSGLKDNNIRSASGRYSIIKGSTPDFITVKGFNLAPSHVRIVSSSDVENASTWSGRGVSFTDESSLYTSFALSNDIEKSGYLEVFTNGIRSLNNINENDASGSYISYRKSDSEYLNYYNREPDFYISKNRKLTDDRYLLVFDMKDTGVKNGYYPNMIMEGDDPVFGYIDFNGGPNNNYGIQSVVDNGGAGSYYSSHAMPQRGKFDGSSGAVVYKEYLIKACSWDQMGMARDDGGRFMHVSVYDRDTCFMSFIYDRYAELYPYGGGWGSKICYSDYNGNFSDNSYNNAITLESVNYGSGLMLKRYQYPKLIAKGNSVTGHANIYMLYYDAHTEKNNLIFRNFRIGVSDAGENMLYKGGFASDGKEYAQYANIRDKNMDRITAVSGASRHFAFDVTPQGRVVIVYFDESERCLKLAYSADAVDCSDPGFGVNFLVSKASFPAYLGNYVSMKIDSDGGIHISAFDSSDSDLAYIYMPSYDSKKVTPIKVDASFSVGKWTQIKLKDSKIPYIAYINSSETGSCDAIKLAYEVRKGVGVDPEGYTTGSWEYMTVPSITPPQCGDTNFQNVCLDFDSSGKPVVGYLGSNIEFGKWLEE